MVVEPCHGMRNSCCVSDPISVPNFLVKQSFDSIGSKSSTISLSIVQRNSTTISHHSCVGYIGVGVGTLLAKCADNERTFNIYSFIYIISWTWK